MHQSEQTPERRYGLYARSVAKAMALGMADYRTYIRGDDGHFVGCRTMLCADDAEAVERAKGYLDGCDIELWCGDRFVMLLIHEPK